MTNAQEWLNSKFPRNSTYYENAQNQPLRIKREDLTELQIEAQRVRWVTLQNQGAEEVRESIDLAGELEVSEYVNLVMFYVKNQPNLTAIKGAEKLAKLVFYRVEKCPQVDSILSFFRRVKERDRGVEKEIGGV